jgi:hypothetical protein
MVLVFFFDSYQYYGINIVFALVFNEKEKNVVAQRWKTNILQHRGT